MEEHNCHHLLGALSDYIDGDLSDELCTQLKQHLAECTNCQIVVDTLSKTVSLYHAIADTSEMPADVSQRLFAILDLKEK